MEKIHLSAKILLRIVNDILDFSEIEVGRLEMENVVFRLDEVLETVTTLIAARAYEKGVELLCSRSGGVPIHVHGDPLRLQQVLLNLLDNAVKFTDSGEVELRVDVAGWKGQTVELRFMVRDTGIGIIPEQIEPIFEPFTQADASTTRQYGGTGLGLTISRRLAELMGGSIGAQSQVGRGSEFVFNVTMGAVQDDSVNFQLSPELRGLRVGLVVDNVRNREILQEMLSSLTFHISEEAQTGELWTGGDRSGKPDLLVIDACSMRQDGLQWLSRQREREEFVRLPALVLCPQPELMSVQDVCEGMPVTRSLAKPVTVSQLFDAVAELFGALPAGEKRSSKDNWLTASFRAFAGKRALLAEDNPVNQQVAVDLLGLVGMEVEVAGNGADAVELARTHTYDVILMDVQMPVMDGYDATRHIRRHLGLDMPIIAMTANAMAGDREKSLEAGMNDHVSKPIDPQHLFKTLQRWMFPDGEAVGGVGREEVVCANPEGEESLPVHLPGIDLDVALYRCADSRVLLWRLLRRFAVDQAGVTKDIRETWSRGEGQEAVRLAHTLKGLAGSIGAEALQAAAYYLEQGLTESPADVPRLLETLESLLQPLLHALGQLPSAASSHKESVSKRVVREEELVLLLQPLQEPLHARQPKACQALVDRLEAVEVPLTMRSRVTHLIKLIRKYRFKEAEQELQELLRPYITHQD